jgi:hypothetical protein
MTVQIDFALNRRFGVVEQTIFRLVLNGLTNIQQISNLLWIFSDEVIANAIRKLVNQQVVCADLDARTLSLSEAVLSIIDTCLNNSYDIKIPDTLVNKATDGNLLITDTKVKEAILAQLLPNIKIGFLADSLDFNICERGRNNE